ncbi:MAG: flagellin FliC [Magnetococcus sp. MYC-9]
MALSINNTATLLAGRQALEKTNTALGQNFQRLSTGLRVNSAADSNGSVALAARMTSQIGGAAAAKRNANDTLTLIQVADAALTETTNALQKARDLAVDARTATKTDSDRLALQETIKGLVSEISRLATGTEIFGQRPLNGGFAAAVQVSPNVGQTLAFTVTGASLQQLGLGVSGSRLNVSTMEAASTAIAQADEALNSVAMMRAALGGVQNRLSSIVGSLDSVALGYTQARSRILDTDVAEEASLMARNAIQQQASIAVFSQANLQSQALLKLLPDANR